MQQDIEKKMQYCLGATDHDVVLKHKSFICYTCEYAVKKTCRGLVLMK